MIELIEDITGGDTVIGLFLNGEFVTFGTSVDDGLASIQYVKDLGKKLAEILMVGLSIGIYESDSSSEDYEFESEDEFRTWPEVYEIYTKQRQNKLE